MRDTEISAPSRQTYTYSESSTTSDSRSAASSTYPPYQYPTSAQQPPSASSYQPQYNPSTYPSSYPSSYPASYAAQYATSYPAAYAAYTAPGYPVYSTCPPGCTCAYSASYLQPAPEVTPSQIRQLAEQQYSAAPANSADSDEDPWSGVEAETGEESQVNLEYAEETAKFPFTVIIQSMARGLVGEQYASKVTEDTFRIKLESKDSQRLSGLSFVKAFSQRDLNLQCTLLMEVIKYWSLEDTLPEQEDYNNDDDAARSERSSRRDSRSGKHKRRPPPPPRYWTRLENAAVLGLMLGLEFEVIKLVLEGQDDASLGDVDAILDTNSAEVCGNSFYRNTDGSWNLI